MWLVSQKVILTKDNMVRRNWQGNPNCYFCGSIETIDHLLFSCPVVKVVWGVVTLCFKQKDRPNCLEQFNNWIRKALLGGEAVYMFSLDAICWTIWKARNRACFEKKFIKNPNEVIFSACLFMHFWAGLFKGDMKEKVKAGAEVLMNVAVSIGERSSLNSARRLISDGRTQDHDSSEEDHGAMP
jgi:hypothetical protein